jgi:MinD superfamily P-loop ATPase
MLKYILSYFNKNMEEKQKRNPIITQGDYRIDPEKCWSCGGCKRTCKAGAISGERGKGYVIDEQKCIKCGACMKRCRFRAIKCN